MTTQLKPLLFLVTFSFIFLSGCKKYDYSRSNNCFSPDSQNNILKKRDNAGSATVSLFATGLNNPRGLKFGPDCKLYVAEAGLGGTENSDRLCPQLVPPDGPYLGSTTGGRISKFGSDGARITVTDKLPTAISHFGDILGPSDVAFIGNSLYALLFAGCGHGVPTVPTSVVKMNSDGTFTVIADLGAWRVAHPVAHPPMDDFDAEGAWYNMISVGNDLYVVDANHGEVVKVTTVGVITSVIDLSAKYGHLVPTALAYHGTLYAGNIGVFPFADGSSNIYKITPGGQTQIVQTGLTAILGLVFDNRDRMYVLETTTGQRGENEYTTPGTGKVLRVNPDGSKDEIATGLSNPTAIAYGPDGNLYVLNWGFAGVAGAGEILKVALKD
jgi:hypothetical protein